MNPKYGGIGASRDLEAMTWEELCGLFMEKYFPASTQHAKAWEFLELRQGTMTMLKYVAKFIELARFADDYVAIDMAKVRKIEDGLKLSIWGKIVGLLLQDLDSMVRTIMAIEREVDDLRNIQDALKIRGKRVNLLLLIQGRSRRLILHKDFRDRVVAVRAKAISRLLAS